MKNRRLALSLCLLLLLGASSASASPPGGMSVDAAFYLNLALNIMQRESINRTRIDWDALRTAALTRAAGAQTYADTYPAIELALQGLGDGHSFFTPPVSLRQGSGPTSADIGRLVAHRYGYIATATWVGDDAGAYAARLQRMIGLVERSSPCGWIVDLRGTRTRALAPLLAGVGPILGEGIAARVLHGSHPPAEWFYRDGLAGFVRRATGQWADAVQISRPLVLDTAWPPVAVLTGRRTASAGEGLAVAFRGRPNTRSFGKPTAGASTHLDAFRLRDGVVLHIATSTLADRTGTRYGGPIQPDLIVDGPDEPRPGIDDAIIEAAVRWLAYQPACARAMAWVPWGQGSGRPLAPSRAARIPFRSLPTAPRWLG